MLPDQIKYLLPPYTRGRGLELGCGEQKTFKHFIGIENGHRGRGGADIISGFGDLALFADQSVPYVVVDNLLPGMTDKKAAVQEWCRVIAPDGYLCLFAHGDFDADWTFLQELPGWLPSEFVIERNMLEHNDEERGVFIVAKRGECVPGHVLPMGGMSACVVRLGGFGDMLQTAAILPRLKEQGYHVAVMTTPKGQDILREDPHVDAWCLIDDEQVPNAELAPFFREQAKQYDRFINLCESVEGTFLAMEGRVPMTWNHQAREFLMNRNYMEFAAALAGVQFRPCQLFYPSQGEQEWAEQQIGAEEFPVMWALSGSSLHKFYPHMDAVVAQMLLTIPNVRIFFTGDQACEILEQPWRNEPRISCLSNQINIRETLALAQRCKIVIGPETGVLNAVAYDREVHKVILLSHSSGENLTKHWIKTQALTPEGCPCYPCHKLITDRERQGCPVVDNGASLCADRIAPRTVWQAVERAWKKAKPWSWR